MTSHSFVVTLHKINFMAKYNTKEYKREWYAKNKHKAKEYREANKHKMKKWREDNKEHLSEYSKNYVEKNKEKIKEYEKKRIYDPVKAKISNAKKWQKNKEKYSAQNYLKKKYKLKTDPLFKLKETLRRRLLSACKAKSLRKSKSSFEIFGANPFEIKAHLEKQFKEGMTWSNHGKWHIDHIIPLALAKNEGELYKLSHYTNLQPLWAEENYKKHDKLPKIMSYEEEKEIERELEAQEFLASLDELNDPNFDDYMEEITEECDDNNVDYSDEFEHE